MKRRNTPAKQHILSILERAGSALSQDMIEQEVKGDIDRVTIYRVLNSFCADGIVHRVTSDDSKGYYALCHDCDKPAHRHDHIHFKCMGCGKVECLPGHVAVKLPEGYREETMNCWISGYCKACAPAHK